MDMSFPSATVLLSNTTPDHDQAIASSLINATVNYSISLGLGIAGTIVHQVNMGSTDAWYFGIGLDGIAVLIALYFCVKN